MKILNKSILLLFLILFYFQVEVFSNTALYLGGGSSSFKNALTSGSQILIGSRVFYENNINLELSAAYISAKDKSSKNIIEVMPTLIHLGYIFNKKKTYSQFINVHTGVYFFDQKFEPMLFTYGIDFGINRKISTTSLFFAKVSSSKVKDTKSKLDLDPVNVSFGFNLQFSDHSSNKQKKNNNFLRRFF